jgi:hypothetical protein
MAGDGPFADPEPARDGIACRDIVNASTPNVEHTCNRNLVMSIPPWLV